MPDIRQLLVAEFERAGFPLTPLAQEQFLIYLNELKRWGARINLTAVLEEREIIVRHFIHSLLFLQAFEPRGAGPLLDVGSGAGFPGLPIRIYRPGVTLTLLDSSHKKTAFLRHLLRLLGIRDVEVVTERAEQTAQRAAGSFAVILSRQTAPLGRLLPSVLPLLQPGGIFVVQKGEGAEAGLASHHPLLSRYGAGLRGVIPVQGQGARRGCLVVVERCSTWNIGAGGGAQGSRGWAGSLPLPTKRGA